MFQKSFFRTNIPRDQIITYIAKEGFHPTLITDPPKFNYETHQHPETKLIVCLEGSMKVTVNEEIFDFEPGDLLKIPGNTSHSGVVGERGCVYFWSEKIL
jgi:quercetin dioxygenase-like cupin family protein